MDEGNPVGEGTTRRGTATPVHRPQRPAGSTHSSTRGLRPPEHPVGPPHSPWESHVELEGLQHGAVAAGDRREQAHDLLNNAVQVVQPTERVKAQRALAGAAAAVQEALSPQLLPQLLQHGRVLQQLHDKRGAGAGSGGVGSKDELQGPVLQQRRGGAACNLGSAWRQPLSTHIPPTLGPSI